MKTDRELLDEQALITSWFRLCYSANQHHLFAIDACMRGLDARAWEHLFEAMVSRDEAREVLDRIGRE